MNDMDDAMSNIDFPALFQLLDLAVFERHDDDHYGARSPLPAWAADVLGTADASGQIALRVQLPFLDHFLAEADAFWWGRRDGAVASAPFAVARRVAATETEDYLLRAWAVRQGERQLIVVLNLRGEADLRPVLQAAREQRLEHDALVKHLAPVHGAVEAIASASSQLQAPGLTDDAQRAAVAALERATETLQAAAGHIPAPPKGTRGFKA